MDNQLIIRLKTDRRIEGRLARSFRNSDTDLEVIVSGERASFRFKLDEICYIRFHRAPAALTGGEPARFEEIQTTTGESFTAAVYAQPQFQKGFIALLQGAPEPYRTIFFTTSGVARRGAIATLPELGSGDRELLVLQDQLLGPELDLMLPAPEPPGPAGQRSGGARNVRTGDILVEAGLVTREQVEAALRDGQREPGGGEQGEPEPAAPGRKRPKVGELLVMRGLITEEQLISALATKFRLPMVDLEGICPSDAALAAISQGLASRLQVFPVSLDRRKLVVATSAPTDLGAEDILRFSTNCAIEFVVCSSRQIAAAIEKYYFRRGETVDTLLETIKGDAESLALEDESEDEVRLLFEPDSEVISLVNRLLIDAYKRGASDIHLEPGPGQAPLVVRYRIDGECVTAHRIVASYKWAIIARIKILAMLDIAERRRPQSGKILLRYHQQKLEYRVEITPLVGGREGAVLRLLVASKPLPLSQLALMPKNLERFTELLERPYGIILCVGPTGSGKTTTLHSALGHINYQERKIWTAEDPVEITQLGLCQVQVNPKIGFTFAEALRSFLRADPDVIMIGEMRDPETAKIAIEASLTGHLVLSTLHTNSSTETVLRLIEMGMDPFNFADALIGILAQRLAKRLCEHCKKPLRDGKRELYERLAEEFERSAGRSVPAFPGLEEARLMEKCGCEQCGGTGYKGRIAIQELMTAIPDIKRAIRHQARVEELREIALREEMWTLKMDGILKVLNGDTDLVQILRVCM